MKRTTLTKPLLVAILLLCSLDISAYDFVTDGIYYNIANSIGMTCEVTYETSSYNSYSGSVTIPEKVTRSSDGNTYTVVGINRSAFYGCSDLTDIEMPSTITYIDDYAFYRCTGLTSVDIPNSVTTIGDYAFYQCSGLTSVTIGNGKGKTTIGWNAFENCTGLTSLTIGNSVTEIGKGAFQHCTGLTSVDIPDSVTTIEDGAFYYCINLTSLTLGNSVTTIEYGTFEYCESLTLVTLGASLTSIDYYAFCHCSSLKAIYLLNPEPPECIDSRGYGYKVFDGVDKEACTLYVPIGSHDAYATADQWEEFLNIVEMDMTGIESVIASSEDVEVVGYYTIGGKSVKNPQRGINILRYSDGSTKKVMVK